MKRKMVSCILVTILLLGGVLTFAGAGSGGTINVAVFDFDTKEAGVSKLGPRIADMITAYLSQNPDLNLVERAELDKVLSEMGLSMTGIVDQAKAVQVGHVVGAKILVTGRAFPVDGELVIVAKIIGTETTRVYGDVAKGSLSGKLISLINDIAVKVAKTIKDKGTELLPASEQEVDKVAIIQEKLKGKKLPRVAVKIEETHIGSRPIDPAAETEFIYLLRKCGFEVVDQSDEVLSNWAKAYLKDSGTELPELLQTVDIVLVGEAFSQFAARTGDLVSSKARVEVRAIDAHNSRILAIDRTTTTAVDLAEQIAAKTALQEGALDIAVSLIPEMVEKWQSELPEADSSQSDN
ncbi:MAG: CsgG/HfaB family protein [Candidatus Euphemobacter frigidus]|nr:CsgG/HfaB family protein [Candidatus Euphemobacter frigidus]MDP8276477.1 CsgG/HfaB family protein [Candidatus Euphemobacter frigidus]